jgi:hypothetical protein
MPVYCSIHHRAFTSISPETKTSDFKHSCAIVAIRLHLATSSCTSQTQTVLKVLFSLQLLLQNVLFEMFPNYKKFASRRLSAASKFFSRPILSAN